MPRWRNAQIERIVREMISQTIEIEKGRDMSNQSVEVVDVAHEGSKIILPNVNGVPMPYDTAINWIQRKAREEEEVAAVYEEMPCSPLDGLVAFHRALSQKFGWVNLIPTPNFFGKDEPPIMVGIPIGPNETLQVAYGRMRVPGVDGYLETRLDLGDRPGFLLAGEVKRKHQFLVREIADLTKKFLKEQSIYKGQAVKVSWAFRRNKKPYDPIANAPQFMDLDPSLESTLIFGDRVASDLNIGLFTPIEQTAACRKYNVPLKRGVLLYGPYGTGKTLTANITALKAQRNGWTFVYLDSVQDLKMGLEFAAHYAPAVVFAEDIDRVMSGERSMELDEILNTLDGVDTKNGEVITVFTSNHIEKINPAVLRMGRLDALVEVSPPDAGAARRLVQLYARGLLEEGADLELIGARLAGKIPAFIREVTERAKIAAIARVGGGEIEGKVQQVDLLNAAHAMETHNSMIWRGKVKSKSHRKVILELPVGTQVETASDFCSIESTEQEEAEFGEEIESNNHDSMN